MPGDSGACRPLSRHVDVPGAGHRARRLLCLGVARGESSWSRESGTRDCDPSDSCGVAGDIRHSPRIHATLRAQGRRVGEHRVARLMRAHAIRAKMVKKWRATTDSAHAHPVAPNRLHRQFAVAKPQPGLGRRHHLGGLAVSGHRAGSVLSPAIAWAMGSRLTEALAHEALSMALGHRQPAEGLMHHTDRGSQGGFKWSLQHLAGGGCDEHSKAAFGSVWAAALAVTRSTAGGRTR